ncbi:hypothetical protein N24_0472 [Corynebacterium suranareeae]|uniref:Secreted protein n=1 Tax=Corynebacterium suranareeae TaxID=2506452 RepID=A0A160PN21_9CORY|nr:hypothetical protein [Corynebacterium suranareeae]BAU94734.1 hypothetical protein N24_0472 [Corynebacterium suranareeae]
MQNITRKFAAATLAASLFIPTTITVANAQSSFVSGSSEIGSSKVELSKAERFHRGYAAYGEALGHTANPSLKPYAQDVLTRALDGEFPLKYGDYYWYDAETGINYTIEVWTDAEIDYFLFKLDEWLLEAEIYPDKIPTQFALEVGTSGAEYISVIAQQYPI